jgi:hypothetical protein
MIFFCVFLVNYQMIFEYQIKIGCSCFNWVNADTDGRTPDRVKRGYGVKYTFRVQY